MAHSNLVESPPTVRPELVEGYPLPRSLGWSHQNTVMFLPAVLPDQPFVLSLSKSPSKDKTNPWAGPNPGQR